MASERSLCSWSLSAVQRSSTSGLQILPVSISSAPAKDGKKPHSNLKVIVVHGGARDAYQLAIGLAEAGLLEALVTDLFWSEDSAVGGALSRLLPAQIVRLFRQRSAIDLPRGYVRMVRTAALGGLIDRLSFLPFSMRRWIARSSDAALGRAAGNLAKRAGAGLVSYSYFGYDAFEAYGRGGLLFQAHPHPATMRRILQQELNDHPDCADSLQKEWELALPEEDFQHLLHETGMASHYLAASSFTRNSLVSNGIAKDRIGVVPYGVDLKRFCPDPGKSSKPEAKLRLLFVGRINQRKGIKYLIEALRHLPMSQIEVMICGRVVDDLEIFKPIQSHVEIRPNISAQDLVRAYQSADLFVFPSIAEGFGQVLLESLACGLPILSTTHTAAPDLIEDGVEGFIVEPRRSDLLAARIEWALKHRVQLAEMGSRARQRAERFTWQRFRTASAQFVETFLTGERSAVKREVA